MKLSISTFKIIASFWNNPIEVLECIESLKCTIEYIERNFSGFKQEEEETAKEEIKQLIETL